MREVLSREAEKDGDNVERRTRQFDKRYVLTGKEDESKEDFFCVLLKRKVLRYEGQKRNRERCYVTAKEEKKKRS